MNNIIASTEAVYENILEKFFHTETIKDYSLERITRACKYFGNPERSFKSIHVAGTNGKGSVSKMIFQMLKESGKSVGVYTSPHHLDIRERFEMDTGLMSQEDFIRYADQLISYDGGLSYFERCTILAFLYFRDTHCEYAVIEVGIGGRLDATNIIMPVLSIITSISYDHMELLGNTLEEISQEKGGIIKPHIPVILYGENTVLQSIAQEQSSEVIFPKNRDVHTNLIGAHQRENARIAFEAGICLDIPESTIHQALLHVQHLGRLEYIRPNLLIDGAHNEDGLKKLKAYLEGESGKWDNIVYHFNLKQGKPAQMVTDIFPEVREWHIIASNAPIVSSAALIQDEVERLGKQASIVTPETIFDQANIYPNTLFVVFGSLYMLEAFLRQQ